VLTWLDTARLEEYENWHVNSLSQPGATENAGLWTVTTKC